MTKIKLHARLRSAPANKPTEFREWVVASTHRSHDSALRRLRGFQRAGILVSYRIEWPTRFASRHTAVVEHVTLESVYASNLTDETNSGWAGR